MYNITCEKGRTTAKIVCFMLRKVVICLAGIALLIGGFSYYEYTLVVTNTYNVSDIKYGLSNGLTFNIGIQNNGFIGVTIGKCSINIQADDAVVGVANISQIDIGTGLTKLPVLVNQLNNVASSLLTAGNITLTGLIPVMMAGIVVYTYNLNYSMPVSEIINDI